MKRRNFILVVVVLSLLLITSGAMAGIRDKAHAAKSNSTILQQRSQGAEENYGTESSYAMRKPADKPRIEFYNEFPLHHPEPGPRRHNVQMKNDINLHRLPKTPIDAMMICFDPNGVFRFWLERLLFD